MPRAELAFLVMMLVGCDASTELDAGFDGGSQDAGVRDADLSDAGPGDAGPIDDAGPADADLDSGVDSGAADAGRPCLDGGGCPFGEGCAGGFCRPLGCHPGSTSMGVAARECGDGFVCDLLLPGTGSGVCVAYAPGCGFDSDCVFGFRCAGTCVRSECHAGSASDLGDYAARPCDSGTCEFGDGADLNGGRGTCVE